MFLKSAILQSSHGFFTRENSTESAVLAALGAKQFATAKQVHGDVTLVLDKPTTAEADALVTNVKGLAIGVYTADCVPVLLEDRKSGVVGVAHAGWKGARFGIIGSVIRTMENMGAQEISAAIGPCIQQQSYEVSAEFIKVFLAEKPENNQFFERGKLAGKYQFNLPKYVESKLLKNGVTNIEILAEDTFSQPEKFCSYRRKTLENLTETGRQISAICL